MPTINETKAWIADRARKDDALYEQYGRALEAEHAGEFVAISDDGRIILGSDPASVLAEATERYDPDPFTFRKVGAEFVLHMRSPRFVGREGDERMPTLREIKEQIAERAQKDEELYEQYGRSLEAEHAGKFVAIGDDGQVILGTDYLAVSDQAVERYGAGNFALRKIGADAEFHLGAISA
ncbi:MAG: hypothetical protein ACRDJH_11200 [Thermomicrobiales bacterium]